MTYGYEVKGRHDKKLDISKRMNDFGNVTFLPGALLVNELPFCMHPPIFGSVYQTYHHNSGTPYPRLGALFQLPATCSDWP
jgi:hypothetical protein